MGRLFLLSVEFEGKARNKLSTNKTKVFGHDFKKLRVFLLA
jgi:hypothetical protein